MTPMARCGICSGISENNTELPDPYELILYGKKVVGTWCDKCIVERTAIAEQFAQELRSLERQSAAQRESQHSLLRDASP